MSGEGYHPNKSRIGNASLDVFIRSPLTADLLKVPGIGPASLPALNDVGITTTFQLIAQYLSLKGERLDADGNPTGEVIGSVEHTERFYLWLVAVGTAAGHRAGTVKAIALKMNYFFPGIYDDEAYEGLDESDA